MASSPRTPRSENGARELPPTSPTPNIIPTSPAAGKLFDSLKKIRCNCYYKYKFYRIRNE